MRIHRFTMLGAAAYLTIAAHPLIAADDAPRGFDRQQARAAVERGLLFLDQDAARWREERKCSTCHHGTMTVWAHLEAQRQGYALSAEKVRDTVAWTKTRLLERIDLPRDERPGWSMVSTPSIYFSIMAQAFVAQDAFTPDELKRIAGHLLRNQEADGSWAWSSAPPKNRPPPFFESDEMATRLAFMALAPHAAADAGDREAVRESRQKAGDWLAKQEPSDTTQAIVLRLLMKSRAGDAGDEANLELKALLDRQNTDGGWGQLKESASDAYATGQALYVLHLIGADVDSDRVGRAIAFLIASQNEDGSWPMTPRSHAGATPSTNTTPITYFGSAWGTLGLLRWTPHGDE